MYSIDDAGEWVEGVSAVALVFICILLRGRRRAALAWVVLWTVAQQPPAPGDPMVDLVYKAVAFTIGIVLLVRFGLLPNIVHLITQVPLTLIALRFDAGVPYAGASYLLVGSVAALALYGFHTALAGQTVFGTGLVREAADVSRS